MDEVEAEVASFISISPRKSDSYSLLKNSNSISPRKGISIHQDTVVPSVSLQNTVPVYISSPQGNVFFYKNKSRKSKKKNIQEKTKQRKRKSKTERKIIFLRGRDEGKKRKNNNKRSNER